MKLIKLSLFSLLLSTPSFAAESRTCEDWKKTLPPRYARDIISENDPSATPSDHALVCGKQIGSAAVSYLAGQGKKAVILQLAARIGISGATASLLMTSGGNVMLAYRAGEMMYRALERDSQCFYNHAFKRGLIEPVAHFYPEEHVENMVQSLTCGEILSQVRVKIQYLESEISVRQRKQEEFEVNTRQHTMTVEQAERRYPLAQRELSPEQKIFVEKRTRMERPIPLLNAAAELLPCLKPQAITRLACDLVVETANAYLEPKAKPNKAMEPELIKLLIKLGSQRKQ